MNQHPNGQGAGAERKISCVVRSIEEVAEKIKLFTFEPRGHDRFPTATAGSHIDVHLPGGLLRQYSLVLDDAHREGYTVAVKREPAGRGGSICLHDRVQVGTELTVSEPRNLFPLAASTAHVVLFAGGIGITPIWSMLSVLRREGRPFECHYAARTRSEMAFHDALLEIPEAHMHVDEESGTLLDIAAICKNAPRGSHFYCCGPLPMMEAFLSATAEVPKERVHVEYFASRQSASTSGGFKIELARSKMTLEVKPGQRIVDVLLAAGVNVPVSCEKGVCGSCETRVISGLPDHRDEVLSEEEREEGRSMMVCCSGSKSEVIVLDI